MKHTKRHLFRIYCQGKGATFMFVEFILALLPIIWLFIAFLVLKMPGYIGCLIALGYLHCRESCYFGIQPDST